MNGETNPPLAVSMGEPAGVGPDLLLKIFSERASNNVSPFIVYGQAAFLRNRAARLGIDVEIEPATPETAGKLFADALPVAEVDGLVPDKPGEATPVSAQLVINSIAEAVKATLGGACRGIVTAPIHKAVLYSAGFKYPGHTEYIAALCSNGGQAKRPVMMLLHGDLRAVPLTVHVPIARVPAMITTELILSTGRTLAHDLRTRFGITEPKIGVAGLNPHAGENGNIGMEEFNIIAPAVAELVFEGFDVEGPFPADTLFYPPHWRRYHAVIAMYHDQALIPIKTVGFDKAVNLTLGLPIVRTSPDHGTAFDLAGTGKASTASFLAALKLADRLTA
jgi:4-hydroxythreonine-4-phosphate dehydrogenase